MILSAVVFVPFQTTWGAVLVFLCLSWFMLLFGHSLGMHRGLIHRAFSCHKPFERVLVWIGVMVGMAGPLGVIRIHDIRDWAQREPKCHDFFSHRRGLLLDLFWQLNCRFQFQHPPRFVLEPDIAGDAWYRWMERSWPLHQFVLGIVLFQFGGWPWVVWGVAVRVAVSVCSHWIVTWHTHNPGPGRWRVPDAGVQASNLPMLAFLTHGECWHNNHHAFPESAKLGLEPGQIDTGWLVLRVFERLGFVTRLGLPRGEHARDDLEIEPSGHIRQRDP